jgi:hypothetical protein
MNWQDVLAEVLRGLSLGANLAGLQRYAGYLDAVANLVDANEDVEAHMKLIVEKLKAGPIVDADFKDAYNRIQDDLDRLNE